MSVFGSSGDGGAGGRERARQAAIRQGKADIDQKFSGFTPEFYDRAAQDYVKAQTPEMMEDFQSTKNNLAYSLSRAGLVGSSVATQRDTSLNTELAKNTNRIAQNAAGFGNDIRGRVNAEKGQLVQQLEASADPSAATAMAEASAAQLRGPSPIQPLGNLFADWSQQYLVNQTQAPDASVWSKLTGVGMGQSNPATYMVG